MLRVIENFRVRLNELLPKRPNGTKIEAWNEFSTWLDDFRATTLARLDALEAGAPPPPNGEPEPEPPPTVKTFKAPQTYNLGSGNQDPRYCTVGLPTIGSDTYEPNYPDVRYDPDGLCRGGRSRTKIVSGLKPADQMDGRSACDPYGPFPPWPADSYRE